MPVIAFVGFGELASGLAGGLAAGRYELRALLRRAPVGQRRARLRAAGVAPYLSPAPALAGAQAVLAAVPPEAAPEALGACAPWLAPGALYVDLSSSSPEAKAEAARIAADAGARYVDAAVLGTVLTSGAQVPILASGPGAGAFAALVGGGQLRVTVLDGPPGAAAKVKLLRSLYLKGRDALIVETLLAARRHGVEQLVAASLETPGDQRPFGEIAERVLRSLALHAGRRAEELREASELAAGCGVDPALARAGADTLAAVAALGLRERFQGERPADGAAVLAAIDERLRAATGAALP